jgi:hypothetical protein
MDVCMLLFCLCVVLLRLADPRPRSLAECI